MVHLIGQSDRMSVADAMGAGPPTASSNFKVLDDAWGSSTAASSEMCPSDSRAKEAAVVDGAPQALTPIVKNANINTRIR